MCLSCSFRGGFCTSSLPAWQWFSQTSQAWEHNAVKIVRFRWISFECSIAAFLLQIQKWMVLVVDRSPVISSQSHQTEHFRMHYLVFQKTYLPWLCFSIHLLSSFPLSNRSSIKRVVINRSTSKTVVNKEKTHGSHSKHIGDASSSH